MLVTFFQFFFEQKKPGQLFKYSEVENKKIATERKDETIPL